MKLNYKEFGSGKPLIIIHGLFGSLDNWVTLGKKFAEHYRVFLLDERNHGQSPHSNEFSYEVMADDLREFIEEHSLQGAVVMGHSMGGKTAMMAALTYPELIDRLIVIDIAPKSYEVHHQTILDGLLAIDFDAISSRSEADRQLSHYIPEEGVRQFLLKSLYWKEKNRLALRFNLDAINREIIPLSSWNERREKFNGPVLFIKGGKSDYIAPNDPSIGMNFPQASLLTVKEAGHWVNADAPAELYEMVRNFIG
jgi:pimeloyl-ACP methyl ester carboxylesterase